MPDGLLIHLRDTYPLETAWAPPWVDDELRQARTGARDAHLAALRTAAEAAASLRRGQSDQAARQQALADSYHAMHDAYRQRETALAQTMNDRTDWEQTTRRQRQLAVAADAELRRRHPDQTWPPLRSAAPDIETTQDAAPASPADITQTIRLIEDLAARHREFSDKLAQRQSVMIPAEDPDYERVGPAFPTWATPNAGAILQPPKPRMQPSPRMLEPVAGREADREAADG
jgi:hypothetical protein